MSNWTAIATADLKDAKVAALIEAMQTAALGSGQTDPTPNIVANVVARIRAEIKGCAANQLDSDTTKIPADLKSLACRMIVREMQSRLQLPLNEDERQEKRDDLRYLERIANCDVPVVAPDNPVDGETQASASEPSVTAPDRSFSRDAQEGL
jgi:phage gp36-like protein